jgi:glycosyltransferase involved in cell wall biosynthesis
MPKITVIMPAYNHEQYIAEAIESVLNQTYRDLELIVINDASTDNTRSVIELYVKKYPDIVYIIDKAKNEGTVAGLNDGIKHARGEYILWLSSDDAFVPDILEKELSVLLDAPQYRICFSGCCEADETMRVTYKYIKKDYVSHPELIYRDLAAANIINGCSILVHRSCYQKVGPFDPRFKYAHDYHMWLRLACEYDILYIPEALVTQRFHTTQVTKLGKNEVDAIGAQFDVLGDEKRFSTLMDKAALPGYDWRVFWLDATYRYHRFRNESESREYFYQVDTIRHLPSMKNADTLIHEQKRLSAKLFDGEFNHTFILTREKIESAFQTVAKRHGIEGILLNKEAVRYQNIQENDFKSILKVIPHDNRLEIVKIERRELEILKANHLFFLSESANICHGDMFAIIGISTYMWFDLLYGDRFQFVKRNHMCIPMLVISELLNMAGVP